MREIARRLIPGVGWRTGVVDEGSPNGGSQPSWGVYSSTGFSIENDSNAPLPLTSLDDGVDLLDRTPPFNFTLAEGVYALTVWAQSTGFLTANGYITLQCQLGGTESFGEFRHPENGFGGCAVAFCTAGTPVNALVLNKDGASARAFDLVNATLVKLS